MEIPEKVSLRAISKTVRAADGCLISQYSIGSHGYPQIGWSSNGKSKMTTAHRAAWANEHGEPPQGTTIDHVCKNKKCVDVTHLRAISNFENARRTNGRDWPIGECANGHPNSDLKMRASGRLECTKCKSEWNARYEAKKRAA